MKVWSITKFKLLRRQKRAEKFFKSYHLVIIFTAFTLLSFSNLNIGDDFSSNNHGRAVASVGRGQKREAPREPIEIHTSYEKLSSANILHVVSTISSPMLASNSVHYKWQKLENAKIISGSLEGDLDLSDDAQEISLDIAIKNPNEPANISIEAMAQSGSTKFNNEKKINLNPEKAMSQQ